MFKLLNNLRNYKKEAVIGPLFKMLEASFELLIPIIMAKIIDVGIKNRDYGYLWKMCAVMIALGLLGLVCSLTAQYFAAKAAQGFGTQLRRDLYNHINSLSYNELDQIGTPTLVTRMTSDINQVQTGVNLLLRLFLRAPFLVLGAVVMAFFISPPVTLVFLAAVPLIGAAIYLITKATIPLYKKVQAMLDRVVTITRENYVGVRVVRAFSRQQEEQGRFRDLSEELKLMYIRAGRISALLNPITYALVNLAIIGILWCGGREVYAGTLTQGELIALINYMTQILMALLALAVLIISVTKAMASAGRVNEVFAQKTTVTDAGNTDRTAVLGAPKVEFCEVSFGYAKAQEPALRGISFAANAGETVGIIGATGSGKTTLVNMIARFYDAGEGAIKVDGHDVRQYPFAQLRRKIGMVPQKAVLFAGTIRANLCLGQEDISDQQLNQALAIAQAKAFVEDKPEQLNTKLTSGGRNLSGGQRQRLTIARALAFQPEILIMDDSASALDFATDAALRHAIRTQTKAMTVFIVSQRAASVKQADKIIVLDDGVMAGIGTHAELLKGCPVYKEICLSQFSAEEVAGL